MNAIEAVPVSADREAEARLQAALAALVGEQRAGLERLVVDLRQYSRNKPPLTVAFACLVMAELTVLESALVIDLTELRRYAIEVVCSMSRPR